MRDVSSKYLSLRTAKATATLKVSTGTIEAIKSGNVPKADPLAVAKVAAIQAAKNTSLLIPYCHQVPLDFVDVRCEIRDSRIEISAEVKAIWRTGVEMEALIAASTAALTLYDMLKIIDDSLVIEQVKLIEKKGGKSEINEIGEGAKAAVLVISDSVSAGMKEDTSGKLLVEHLKSFQLSSVNYIIVPDDRTCIEKELKHFADVEKVDLIVTTGGTGVGPRDVTPEATRSVIERELEGVEEALRNYGQERTPYAMFARQVVGVRGKTVIVNLPGSRKGVEDGLNALLPTVFHLFAMLEGKGH